MKLKFIKYQDMENSFDSTKIITVSDAIILTKVLEDFADFLRACGYVFDGNLEVVPEDGGA